MEFSHVFYKEVPVDEDNIFSANLAENNEFKQIKFKNSKIHAISGLSIDQDDQSNIFFPNIVGKKSDVLRTYAQEKEKFSLDLRIYKEDWFSITVPLQKRMDVLIYGFKYYDTTMPKQETIDFTTIITTLKLFVLRGSIYP